ncbi:TPA: hypothetical protein R1731_001466 [Campylobacter lari]|uniref:hypothetical protein n=1 Tax=Campylobacter TaxID=194 RepID=UPI00127B7426|nr:MULTISPECIES: hypothetical protein [Campylobacter]MBT0825313.1 hypothetical protein [Campylobacter lari]MCV3349850.1 hypothetical protein [Campylobacter sp. RKI_CA19_01127]MCV3377818.1 hypothetical protein [Campylobacter sp. IFREMER_LSEM_CL2194]HEC1777048.1 hypothetical protein [Campylobacter lari]
MEAKSLNYKNNYNLSISKPEDLIYEFNAQCGKNVFNIKNIKYFNSVKSFKAEILADDEAILKINNEDKGKISNPCGGGIHWKEIEKEIKLSNNSMRIDLEILNTCGFECYGKLKLILKY